MTAIPHGEAPLWIIAGAALVCIVLVLVCSRPSRHEHSIYYRTKGRRDL